MKSPKVPKVAVRKLSKIIADLEVWQGTYDMDDWDLAGAAKSQLMRLLRKLEEQDESV
ncbi:MAG: hypothetical protein M0R80_01215 [Proteobacteria bacterium]|jgi:hypothetical protein|nr:hypothetical protein [Pseudomonadota bacterium]